jgi:GAF domain-containing protein
MNSGVTHDRMIEQINEAVRRHLHADRLTVFFYDGKSDELYSYIASGLKPGEIRIPSDGGIAGYVFHSGEMVCVEDAYEDPRFNPEVDRRTGYRTRSMLTMHITNRQGVRIGVVQALNKFEGQGSFTQEDMIFL